MTQIYRITDSDENYLSDCIETDDLISTPITIYDITLDELLSEINDSLENGNYHREVGFIDKLIEAMKQINLSDLQIKEVIWQLIQNNGFMIGLD